METSALNLVLGAGTVVKSVLLLLLAFSVVSWGIIFFKFRQFSLASKENAAFQSSFKSLKDSEKIFASSRALLTSPIAAVFRAVASDSGLAEKEEIRRALRRYEAVEAARLERHLSFLATTGSTTPFIGLFGTVWGIMNSFRGIGAAGTASLAVVAPGIAEALIATAMGLVAAIPAVMAYNYNLSKARRITMETEDFSEEILDLLSRERRAGRTQA
jgi:biopolymer transport protein TolQ